MDEHREPQGDPDRAAVSQLTAAGGPAGVLFEWGPRGAEALLSHAEVFVVVDVLSFTTAATIACAKGTDLYPCGDDEQAAALAGQLGAEMAVNRRRVDAEHPWSLSPASLQKAPAAARLVLPSPNGSAVAALVGAADNLVGAADNLVGAAAKPVIAACLRNSSAVARWLLARGYGRGPGTIAVIASGERWPDGTLRVAVEDLLGAAAVLGHLSGSGCSLSAEAAAVARTTSGLGPAEVGNLLRHGASGRELIAAGYAEDVELAGAVDVDDVVPVMVPGSSPSCFRDSCFRDLGKA